MGKAKRAVSTKPPVDRQKLFEYLVANPGKKTSDLEEVLGFDQLEIRAVFQEWESQSAARREGRTRGTRWFATDGATMPEPLPPEAGAKPRKAKAPKKKKAPKAAAPAKAAKTSAKAPKATKAAKGAKASKAARPERAGRRPGKGRAPQAAILDGFRELLGTVPDEVAAQRTGVPARTIQYYRNKNGIAGYAGPKRKAGKGAAAKAAARPVQAPKAAGKVAAKSSNRSAWRVELKTSGRDVVSKFTFAPNLTEAAALAAAAGKRLNAEVVGLAWVGDALD